MASVTDQGLRDQGGGFLNGLYDPGPVGGGGVHKRDWRSHKKNPYLDDSPPPADLLAANLARAEAELLGLAEALVACQRETRFGRFSDFTLIERYRHGQEVVRGLRSELSGSRRSVA